MIRHVPLVVLATVMAASTAAAQTAPQTIKGLEITVSSVTRADNVSLGDCPPGANIVRGVIRPGDDREYATVTIDVRVTPAFEASAIVPPPQVKDADGKTYRTAQAFTDMGSPETYSCGFSFRVPKGTRLTEMTIDAATYDISGLN